MWEHLTSLKLSYTAHKLLAVLEFAIQTLDTPTRVRIRQHYAPFIRTTLMQGTVAPKSSDTRCNSLRRDSRHTQNTQASYPLIVLCCASEYT